MENKIKIGQMNHLMIRRKVDFGLYLGIDDSEDILIPKRYVPEGLSINDFIDVFVYLDSEDRIIATTETPYTMVNEFAVLKVVSLSTVGAFLDWGLSKDILLPYREQLVELEEGKSYLVHIYLDQSTERIVATMKLNYFLDKKPNHFERGDEVDLIIWSKNELGYKVIIDTEFSGLIHQADVFQNLKTGQKLKAFIKKIRDDGKLDVTLQRFGYKKVGDFSDILFDYMRTEKGYIPIHDKSSPKLIYKTFSVSKATFKKAVGNLYKRRLIDIEQDGLYLKER